jgi:hypothetical protein
MARRALVRHVAPHRRKGIEGLFGRVPRVGLPTPGQIGGAPLIGLPGGPRRGFVPFVPPSRPPPGTYDPSLDANERAAERGLLDLTQDTERAGSRAYTDVFDDEVGALAELARRDTAAEEDYTRNVGQLARNYGILGGQQTQSARAAGVRGGALAQAAAKRTANMAWERAPIDTGIARYRTESGVQRDRIGLDFQRGEEDRGLNLGRAGRELGFFRTDTGEQRWFQAKQSGAELPTAPKGEHQKLGLTYRVKGRDGNRQYTLPSGRTLDRRGWVHLLQRQRRRMA